LQRIYIIFFKRQNALLYLFSSTEKDTLH